MNLRGGVVNKRFTKTGNFNVKINSAPTEMTKQTVEFADAASPWQYIVDSDPDPSYKVTDDDGVTLQEFFSRPIKIASVNWTPGNNFFFTLNPWQSFFTNPRVINRVANYHLLRCKLHVRVMINGNSFYYGRILASYDFLPVYDQFGTTRSTAFLDIIQESQKPHVFINPTDSTGGDIICPFLWPSNALRIPGTEWSTMGSMTLRSFGELKHANGATNPITISIFAWAEDVHMSIPTANQPGALSPQAGPDEYSGGVISKTANAIQKAASELVAIPAIKPYAMATSSMAGAVGRIAGMHGYSKPPAIQKAEYVANNVVGEMCTVEGLDLCTKLSLDPKQELTIDSRTMGLSDTDEMNIASIAMRESYLTSFSWPTTANDETKLFAISVNPVLWNTQVDPISGLTEIMMPACCFAALPFRQWRGTMKFRFQVVSSGFHKGRLRLSYDPSFQLSNEYNTNYNTIVDISNENDFTVEVGWGSDRPMLNHGAPGDEPPLFGPTHNPSPGYQHNGTVTVFVVNELTVPNSTVNNDVIVNVFVSAGEDFEVFNPSAQFIDNYTYFNVGLPGGAAAPLSSRIGDADEQITPIPLEPQAGEETHPDADATQEASAPVQNTTFEIAPFRTAPGMSQVFHGDPIVSFRQCLKRYNYNQTFGMEFGRRWHTWTMPNFPMYRGYAPGAIHTTSSGSSYNFAKMTLMNYLTPAYVCRRGSVRVKYYRERGTTFADGHMMAVRLPFTTSGYNKTSALIVEAGNTDSAKAREGVQQIPSTWPGAAMVDLRTNNTLTLDLPYYNNQRFSYARQANVNTPDDPQYLYNQFHQLRTIASTTATSVIPPRVDAYWAAGDDFTLAMFVGAPRIFRLGSGADPLPEVN